MTEHEQQVATLLARDFGTVPDLVRLHARHAPERPALVQDGRALDYGTLDATMDRIAAALQRDGLACGDTIALCASNSIEFGAVFLGALRAGVAVALLAPSTAPESLREMIADSGATHLFVDAAVGKALAPLREAIGGTVIALDDSDAGLALHAWLAHDARPRPVTIMPDAAFNIIYSSGTTGTPKGVVQPQSMRWAHVQRAPVYGYGTGSVTLLSTPLYSNTTLVAFFPPLALGGTVVLMAKFDVSAWLALAVAHRVTHTMLVPVQYQRMLATPGFDRHDLSSFQMKLSTSAPLSADLKRQILRRWPGGFTELYGMTEGGGTCVLAAHEHPDKLHTVGRPAPANDIRLIDEQGREVPIGGIGEVVGRSRAMMTGYHRRPVETAAAEWHDASGKRFIRTGDIGRFDEDGFLTLLDRRKDMLISGGFNVYPSDLEAVLRGYPEVGEVAVVGVPSTRWGETPVAFVVPREGATIDGPQLLAWANARLGKVQRVAAVEVVAALPRSPIGKVLKRELRDGWRGRVE
jgi:long-chain acyl-CoA synthetase